MLSCCCHNQNLNTFSIFLDSPKANEDVQELSQISCERCKKTFKPNTLLIHIGKDKKCKTFYGSRFDDMKKEKHKETKQRSRKKNGIEKELKSQRESYANNPTKREKI